MSSRIALLCLIPLLLVATASRAQPRGPSLPHPSTHPTHAAKPAARQALFIPPIPPAAGTPAAADVPGKPKPPPPDPNKGAVTGLPVPRFASLRADVVNLRAGPGTRYPIDWVYKRVGMPVEILREFDVWRLVETPDGEKGWMHEATLVGRRDFMVTGGKQGLRTQANATAHTVAIVEPGVIGRILECNQGGDWCHVQVSEYRGWLPRSAMWGLLPNEAISP
jgi:SH3-like domain-containing protein